MVLPAPEGPTIDNISFFEIDKLMFFRTCKSPYDLFILLKNITDNYTSEEIQTEIYKIGKQNNFINLRDFFKLIYQVLLGQEQGPRLGSFVKLYGINKTCEIAL